MSRKDDILTEISDLVTELRDLGDVGDCEAPIVRIARGQVNKRNYVVEVSTSNLVPALHVSGFYMHAVEQPDSRYVALELDRWAWDALVDAVSEIEDPPRADECG